MNFLIVFFLQDTLFPYVRENLKKYIDDKWDDEEFKADLKKLKEQVKFCQFKFLVYNTI